VGVVAPMVVVAVGGVEVVAGTAMAVATATRSAVEAAGVEVVESLVAPATSVGRQVSVCVQVHIWTWSGACHTMPRILLCGYHVGCCTH
jgi:hypothetical protein